MKRVISFLICVLTVLSFKTVSLADDNFLLTFSGIYSDVKLIQNEQYHIVKAYKYLGNDEEAAETVEYCYNENGDIKDIFVHDKDNY